jgi:hypothetical protein
MFNLIEDERAFMAQAIDLVSAHPADLVHLVKPRWPNILQAPGARPQGRR